MSEPADQSNVPLATSGAAAGEEEEHPNLLRLKDDESINYEKMWEHYDQATPKNFYHSIEIAKDGGFSEVGDLHGVMRYVSSVMLILFVLMNAYSLTTVNLAFILSEESPEIFTVTKRYILERFDIPLGNTEIAVIGGLELSLITFYVSRCFYWAFWIWRPQGCCCCSASGHEMYRWQAVQELFWNALPEASTISAVKTLNFVTPQVLFPALAEVLLTCRPGRIVFFFVSRCLAALIGFDSLLYKLQVNSAAIQEALANSGGKINDWGTMGSLFIICITFMNQFLGIVQVSWFVKRRIFAFIFAGEDGIMSPKENALKETWESMLAKRIWECSTLTWYQKIAAYMSYSDYDFQKLALESVGVAKKSTKTAKQDLELAAAGISLSNRSAP